jgi:hypothetical protein
MQPSPNGRRVGIRVVTFEACSGFTHVTARQIAQPPRRPSSRGSSPAGYPAKPLVSFRINRQLSGWNLPPLMIRAFGAHGQKATFGGRNFPSHGRSSPVRFGRLAQREKRSLHTREARRFHSYTAHQLPASRHDIDRRPLLAIRSPDVL